MLKKKYSDTCQKNKQTNTKEDFIQEHCNRQRKVGLNSKYGKDSWGFIVKEQDGGGGSVDGKLLRRDIKGWGILAKGRPQT